MVYMIKNICHNCEKGKLFEVAKELGYGRLLKCNYCGTRISEAL